MKVVFATEMRICNEITFFEINLFQHTNLRSNKVEAILYSKRPHSLQKKRRKKKQGKGFKRQKRSGYLQKKPVQIKVEFTCKLTTGYYSN